MKNKLLISILSLLFPAITFAQGYPLTISEIPSSSGFSSDYDAATATWTLTCENNDGSTTVPYIVLSAITEAVPEEYTALTFEYRSTDDVSNFVMNMYKVFMGSATRTITLDRTIPASDNWTTYRCNLAKYRELNSVRFLNKAGQYQALYFMDLPVGEAIQIRNIRYDENDFQFKEMVLVKDQNNIIEGEDYNGSADNTTGRIAHNNQLPAENTKYIHPTGEYFPIYAWGSVDYDGNKGSDAPEFLHKQYQELWDCGFTITHGTAWTGVDQAFLFDGREINGVYVNLHEGTDLKMICKSGLDSYDEVKTNVPNRMASDRLAGWFIKDEPHYKDFPEMTSKVNWIREFDNDHLLYGNLLNISTDMEAIGFENYDEYVHTFMKEVGTGFISYDYYPVRQYDDTKEIYIEPDFFENLEIVSKLAKYYHTSFWAFAHSVASNCSKEGVSYPTPEEDHMRVQIFGNLAYGAQGVQYFTYKCPNPLDGYTYYDAPIDLNNEKTPVWYMVQNINRDIHALTWVFLGAEFLRAGHTNATTPAGCTRLTQAMLPDGVKSVTSDGQGVCVSMLKNGKNLFMMVLNGDILNTQNVTISKDVAVKRVLMDGSTEVDGAGEKVYELAPGRFVLYLVSENEAESIDTTPSVYQNTTSYRVDTDGLFLTPYENANNGYYLAAMGDPSWSTYSAVQPEDGNRTITRAQATEQWGSRFTYTVDVPADIDVDIYVRHAVPATEYFRVAAIGVTPGYEYVIENAPELNWPKQYAASMTLSIDGEEVVPAQKLRPTVSDAEGSDFDAILADKSRWVSTAEADGSASSVLYLWPQSSTDDGTVLHYNEKADYVNVHIPAGTHKIEVSSLCYPWHFDNLLLTPAESSGVENVNIDSQQGDDRIFNLLGVECHGELVPGIYIRNGEKFIVK